MASNKYFEIIGRKVKSDIDEIRGKNKDTSKPQRDFSLEIKSEFVHKMSALLPIKAFLTKHGYGDKWAKYDINDLMASYAVLRCKGFE